MIVPCAVPKDGHASDGDIADGVVALEIDVNVVILRAAEENRFSICRVGDECAAIGSGG